MSGIPNFLHNFLQNTIHHTHRTQTSHHTNTYTNTMSNVGVGISDRAAVSQLKSLYSALSECEKLRREKLANLAIKKVMGDNDSGIGINRGIVIDGKRKPVPKRPLMSSMKRGKTEVQGKGIRFDKSVVMEEGGGGESPPFTVSGGGESPPFTVEGGVEGGESPPFTVGGADGGESPPFTADAMDIEGGESPPYTAGMGGER